MVNRLWQYHFGRGIVRSSSDFGYQGTPPTHPELLDWLASEFIASGGDTPRLVHQEDAPLDPDFQYLSDVGRGRSRRPSAKDPENHLLWRFSPRRLAAEEVRDSILAVCGNLNPKMGGPSIHPTIPAEVLAGQSLPGNDWDLKCPPEERNRRSVYIHVKRSLAVPILSAFDAADTDGSCPVRFTTTQPTQALGMLNSHSSTSRPPSSPRTWRKRAETPETQVRLVLRRVFQREPTAKGDRTRREVPERRTEHGAKPEEALRSFCLLALNLNEFIYLD